MLISAMGRANSLLTNHFGRFVLSLVDKPLKGILYRVTELRVVHKRTLEDVGDSFLEIKK
jgi:hypothetical protein